MRRSIGLCVALLFVSGLALATDYTWTAGAVTRAWDNTLVWTPNGVPGIEADCATGVADTLTMPANIPTGGAECNVPAGTTLYLGEMTIDNGIFGVSSIYSAGFSLHILDDGGKSGDLTVGAAGRLKMGSSGPSEFHVDGNFLMAANTGINAWQPRANNVHITMYGVGKTVDLDVTSDSWGSFTVAPGASITTGTGVGATVSAEVFTNNGTFSGDAEIEQMATNNGTWTTGTLKVKAGNFNAKINAGTYPAFEQKWASSNYTQTARLMGDVTITGNFLAGNWNNTYAKTQTNTFDTDNGSGTAFDLTVGGNFQFAGSTKTFTSIVYAFNANDSTIEIAGNANFGKWGHVVGGTSTWKFGGDVVFTDDFESGLSTMQNTQIELNGSGAQTLDLDLLLPVGNVVINKTGGALVLADNAVIMGNLIVTGAPDSFSITNEGDAIIFAGGLGDTEGDAQLVDAQGADLINVTIAQGSPTWIKLMSDLIVSDNLNIEAGCGIFLNGFMLTAEGQEITASQTWDEGLIVGGGEIPEPATMLLLGTGILGALGVARRRRMR